VVLFWYGALEVVDLVQDQDGVVEPVVLLWVVSLVLDEVVTGEVPVPE